MSVCFVLKLQVAYRIWKYFLSMHRASDIMCLFCFLLSRNFHTDNYHAILQCSIFQILNYIICFDIYQNNNCSICFKQFIWNNVLNTFNTRLITFHRTNILTAKCMNTFYIIFYGSNFVVTPVKLLITQFWLKYMSLL